jgi:hypothetical protein
MSSGMVITVLGLLTVALIALALWILLRVRATNPEKKERQRRTTLQERGRLGDAMITEVSGGLIYYTYWVHGVQYTASQDVSALIAYLPSEAERLIGASSIKYSATNPGNSILVSERWSGLRGASPHNRILLEEASSSELLSPEPLSPEPLSSEPLNDVAGEPTSERVG